MGLSGESPAILSVLHSELLPRRLVLTTGSQMPLRKAVLCLACLMLPLNAHLRAQVAPSEAREETSGSQFRKRAHELFTWFDTLGMIPGDKPRLILTKHPWSQGFGSESEPIIGILLAASNSRLDYLSLRLWKQWIHLPPRDDKYWGLGEQQSFNEVNIGEATYLFRRLHSQGGPAFGKTGSGMSEFALEAFVLARLADRLGDTPESEKILQLIVDHQLASEITKKKLSDAIAYTFLFQFTSGFANLDTTWSELRDRLKRFDAQIPTHKYSGRLKRMLAMLDSMASEEAKHKAAWEAHEAGKVELTEADLIEELVFQLRNQAGTPTSSHGYSDPFNDPREEQSPAQRLVNIGYPAVPKLIAAIDEKHFTRCTTNRSPDPLGNVLTVGEVAVHVLSRIAVRDFADHLESPMMFEKNAGLGAAKRDALDWWQQLEELGELGLFAKRMKNADGLAAFEIAEFLVEHHPHRALGIIAPELKRIEACWCAHIVDLVAAEPTHAMEPVLSQLWKRPELSVRVSAATGLLKLGHEHVVDELILTWRERSANPQALQLSYGQPGDPNGLISLISFLANCGRLDAIEALAASMPIRDVELIPTVLDCVGRVYGGAETEWTPAIPPQSKQIQAVATRLFLEALKDKRRPKSRFSRFLPDGSSEPLLEKRICDTASPYLARLLSPPLAIDFSATEAEWDSLIEQVVKRAQLELPHGQR